MYEQQAVQHVQVKAAGAANGKDPLELLHLPSLESTPHDFLLPPDYSSLHAAINTDDLPAGMSAGSMTRKKAYSHRHILWPCNLPERRSPLTFEVQLSWIVQALPINSVFTQPGATALIRAFELMRTISFFTVGTSPYCRPAFPLAYSAWPACPNLPHSLPVTTIDRFSSSLPPFWS